jgi:hypothetical protein
MARIVTRVVGICIRILAGFRIILEAAKQLSQGSSACSRSDGVDNHLYCRAIAHPDETDEVFGEIAVEIQLILRSSRRGFATPVVGFIEEAFAVMGPAFIALRMAATLIRKMLNFVRKGRQDREESGVYPSPTFLTLCTGRRCSSHPSILFIASTRTIPSCASPTRTHRSPRCERAEALRCTGHQGCAEKRNG